LTIWPDSPGSTSVERLKPAELGQQREILAHFRIRLDEVFRVDFVEIDAPGAGFFVGKHLDRRFEAVILDHLGAAEQVRFQRQHPQRQNVERIQVTPELVIDLRLTFNDSAVHRNL